jgi:hypothetical protein
MQRWIVMSVVVLALLVGGSGFAYWTYKQGRPHPVWVPLPINPELSDEKREEIAKELKMKLGTTEILTRLSKDLDLPKRWQMTSDDEVAAELGRRLFVTLGEADSPLGKVPSLNIGVQGTRKDKAISEEIAMRLMKEVRKLLGVESRPPKEF